MNKLEKVFDILLAACAMSLPVVLIVGALMYCNSIDRLMEECMADGHKEYTCYSKLVNGNSND